MKRIKISKERIKPSGPLAISITSTGSIYGIVVSENAKGKASVK